MKKNAKSLCIIFCVFKSFAFEELYKGSKIPPGNLLAQALSKHTDGGE